MAATGKPALGDILVIPDPMLSDNFDLIITNVPQFSNGAVQTAAGTVGTNNTDITQGTSQNITHTATDIIKTLRVQCKTAIKPGMTLEATEYQLFGHEVKFAGRLTYSHEMAVEYVENWQGSITRILERWAEVARTHRTQHGNFKSAYATNADLIIYNQVGEASLTYKIFNIWPTQVPDLNFDGSSATVISVQASFAYDFYEIQGNAS